MTYDLTVGHEFVREVKGKSVPDQQTTGGKSLRHKAVQFSRGAVSVLKGGGMRRLAVRDVAGGICKGYIMEGRAQDGKKVEVDPESMRRLEQRETE